MNLITFLPIYNALDFFKKAQNSPKIIPYLNSKSSSNHAQNQFNMSILNLQAADRRITLKMCITVPIFDYDG